MAVESRNGRSPVSRDNRFVGVGDSGVATPRRIKRVATCGASSG